MRAINTIEHSVILWISYYRFW